MLAELVNTYQNTGEMIKKNCCRPAKTGLASRKLLRVWRARQIRKIYVCTLEKLADLSRVLKLLTAVILSCLYSF